MSSDEPDPDSDQATDDDIIMTVFQTLSFPPLQKLYILFVKSTATCDRTTSDRTTKIQKICEDEDGESDSSTEHSYGLNPPESVCIFSKKNGHHQTNFTFVTLAR
jgi:hypothetical protein